MKELEANAETRQHDWKRRSSGPKEKLAGTDNCGPYRTPPDEDHRHLGGLPVPDGTARNSRAISGIEDVCHAGRTRGGCGTRPGCRDNMNAPPDHHGHGEMEKARDTLHAGAQVRGPNKGEKVLAGTPAVLPPDCRGAHLVNRLRT